MSEHRIKVINKGSELSEPLHPEIGEPFRKILYRDIGIMKDQKCTVFIRAPYEDLNELELIQLSYKSQNIPDPPNLHAAVAIMVVSIVKNITNARIPLTLEMFNEEIGKGGARIVDIDTRNHGKGFGRK